MRRTGWYSGDQKPLADRVGWYKRMFSWREVWHYWNGKFFEYGGAWDLKPSSLSRSNRRSPYQSLPWRGITKESK